MRIDEFLRARLDEDDRADSGRQLAARSIAELHSCDDDPNLGPICLTCVRSEHPRLVSDRHPCLTLRFLAAAYADHPDYDAAWSPSRWAATSGRS